MREVNRKEVNTEEREEEREGTREEMKKKDCNSKRCSKSPGGENNLAPLFICLHICSSLLSGSQHYI